MEKRARESLEECINDLNPVLNKYIQNPQINEKRNTLYSIKTHKKIIKYINKLREVLQSNLVSSF